MFRIFLIFSLFQFAHPEECERIECHEISRIAPEIGKLLLAQSSIDNDNVSESVQRLETFMSHSAVETNFKANLCGLENVDLGTFLKYLNLDRRRIQRTDDNLEPIVRYYSKEEFEVEYPVFDKMNLISVEVFRFQISFQVITRRWKVIHLDSIGGCPGYPKVDKTYVHMNISERYRFEEKQDYQWKFGIHFEKDVLPFNKHIENPEKISETFYDGFEAIVDQDNDFTYNINQFMNFMDNFNGIYTYQEYGSAMRPHSTIFAQTSDHLVLRTDANFKFIDRYEVWFIHVEANYNLDGDEKWKISRIYMRPPMEVINGTANLLLAQSSIDNDDLHESIEKFKAYLDSGLFETSFTANICGAGDSKTDLETFLYVLKLERRRVSKTDSSVKPKLRYHKMNYFEVEYPVRSKMNYTSINVFRMTIRDKTETISHLEMDGACTGFRGSFDLTYIHEKREQNIELVESFTTKIPFTSKHLELFYDNFEAFIDNNIELSYDLEHFMEFMDDFKDSHIIESPYHPCTNIFTQNSDHVVFRADTTFKIGERFEVWIFQVEANYNLDGKKQWKISRIYLRPPYEIAVIKADQYQLSVVRDIAHLLLAQSSIDNDNLHENIEKLKAYMDSGILGISFSANLCGVGDSKTDLDTFLYFMKLERRRIMKTDSFVKPRIHYNTSEYFEVKFPVKNKMNFTSLVKYGITLAKPLLSGSLYVKYLDLEGGCEGFYENVDLSYVHLNYTNQANYEENLDIVERFWSEIPFTKYIDEPQLRLRYFYEDFEAFIDNNSELKYNLERFMEFMEDFNNLYIYQISECAIGKVENCTSIFTQTSDHVVFRRDATFKIAESFEVWIFQVEANYNLDGKKQWKISKIYLRPPYETAIKEADQYYLSYTQEVGDLFLALSSIDNDNLTENTEKLKTYIDTSIFDKTFTAKICGAKKVEMDEFFYIMKLDRRRINRTDDFARPRIHHYSPTFFEVELQLTNKMNYSSIIIYRINLVKHTFSGKLFISQIKVGGSCEGFIKNLDSDYIHSELSTVQKNYEHQMYVIDNFETVDFFFSKEMDKQDLRNSLFNENFEAYIDTNDDKTYNLDQYLSYLDDFNQIYTYQSEYEEDWAIPRTTILTKSENHVVFRVNIVFKTKVRYEVFLFQVEANDVDDKLKRWKISRIYMRPPFSRLKSSKKSVMKIAFWNIVHFSIHEMFEAMNPIHRFELNSYLFRHMDRSKIEICDDLKYSGATSSDTDGITIQFPDDMNELQKSVSEISPLTNLPISIPILGPSVYYFLEMKYKREYMCYTHRIVFGAEYNETNEVYHLTWMKFACRSWAMSSVCSPEVHIKNAEKFIISELGIHTTPSPLPLII